MPNHSEVLSWRSLQATELVDSDQALISMARDAMGRAYAPYSRFPVGAALRLSNGQVIVGNNQENASYPNGLCAERVAMFAAAASHPDVAFESLAVVTRSDSLVSPCGICRQTMLEYTDRFGKSFKLIVAGAGNDVLVFEDASALLPLGFSSRHLK
jgi:cytidine deaminase